MIELLQAWWSDNAVVFLLGSLALTALGAGAIALCRAPIYRRRLAEAVIAVFWIWLLLAVVPAQRATMPAPAIPVVVHAQLADRPHRAPEPGAPSVSGADLLAVLGACIAAGAVVMLVRLAAARLRLQRVLRDSAPAPRDIVALAHALPLSARAPRILVSRDVQRPFCCGVLRPRIVLPAILLARVGSPAGGSCDLRSVLLHELAHLAQGDLLGHVLFALTGPLLFWNPLFWWLRRDARVSAELVADDLAARHLTKPIYVRDLIVVAEGLPPVSLRGSAALAVVGRETEFFRRMNMLLTRRDRLATRCSNTHAVLRWGSAALVAIAGSFGWTTTSLYAQGAAPGGAPAPKAATRPADATAVREVCFPFADEAGLGATLTRLVTRGIAIHGLELVPAGTGSAAMAKIKVAAGQLDRAIEVLADSSPSTPFAPVARPPATTPAPADESPSAVKAAPPAAPARKPDPTTPRVRFNFKETEVSKVIATIAKVAGINVILPKTLTGKVTLEVEDISWSAALAMTVVQLDHEVTEEAGIFIIKKRAPPAVPGGR